MPSEKEIEGKACRYAKAAGCWVRKFTSPGQRAAPDRIFMTTRGVVFFIEFKAPGKRPTPLQQREINIIRSKGGHAHWADNLEDAKAIIDGYCMI